MRKTGRARHGLDEHLPFGRHLRAENARSRALELAQGAERAVDRKRGVFGREDFAFVELHVRADREEKAFGDALVAFGERGLDFHVLVVAHEAFVDRGAGERVERLVLRVNVEGEEVARARPAEVGGSGSLKAA